MLARIMTIRLRIPEWVSDEEVERIVREIKERLEEKEKERLRRLYKL